MIKLLFTALILFCVESPVRAIEVLPAPVERLPLLELILHVPGAGYRQDPHGRSGTAALLRAVLDQGDLARQCERLGAVRSSDLDADGMTFRVQGFAADREALVALLWRWVFVAPPVQEGAPLNVAQSLLAERYSHLTDDPESWALSVLSSRVWRGTPSERGPILNPNELKQVTSAELKAFHALHMKPAAAKLWVLGNAEALSPVRAQVQQLELQWSEAVSTTGVVPAKPIRARLSPPSRIQSDPEILDRKAAGPALVYWGSRLVRPTAGELAAFWVANALLGEGSASRLVRRIRDAGGLAYAVQSGFQFQQEGWVWLVSAAAPSQTALPLLKRLKAAVAELRRGPIEVEEFRVAQDSAMGKLKLLQANPRAWVYRSLDIPEMERLVSEIPKVRIEDVLRVLNRAWSEPHPTVVIVGDAVAIRKGAKEVAHASADAQR